MKWYKSKTYLYITKVVWFSMGAYSIHVSYRDASVVFLAIGIMMLFTGFITGRWSYKDME